MTDQFPATLSVKAVRDLQFDEIKQRFTNEGFEIGKVYVVGRIKNVDCTEAKIFRFTLQDKTGEIACAGYTDSNPTEIHNARTARSLNDGDYIRVVANPQNKESGTLLLVTHCIAPTTKEIQFFS